MLYSKPDPTKIFRKLVSGEANAKESAEANEIIAKAVDVITPEANKLYVEVTQTLTTYKSPISRIIFNMVYAGNTTFRVGNKFDQKKLAKLVKILNIPLHKVFPNDKIVAEVFTNANIKDLKTIVRLTLNNKG